MIIINERSEYSDNNEFTSAGARKFLIDRGYYLLSNPEFSDLDLKYRTMTSGPSTVNLVYVGKLKGDLQDLIRKIRSVGYEVRRNYVGVPHGMKSYRITIKVDKMTDDFCTLILSFDPKSKVVSFIIKFDKYRLTQLLVDQI